MNNSALDITLSIRNNTNQVRRASLMGSPYNPLDTANAKTEYKWNVTGFTFTSENGVTLLYRTINDPIFAVFTATLPSLNVQGAVDALNTLQIGYFTYYTELGQTYISTYNDQYIFGALNIFTSSIVDSSFMYGTGFDSNTTSSYTQPDGKIIVIGAFLSYDGNPASSIIRLNNDGSVDGSFVSGTGFDGEAKSVAFQPDGKIIIGGFYSLYDGTSANNIIRLNNDGSIDTSFLYGTGFNNYVNTITVQSDGNILLGGLFTSYNGTPANMAIRLNSNGSIDTSFVYGTGFDNEVIDIVLQPDSKILVGGFFGIYNGTPASEIIRLNSNGSIDTSFVYGTGFDSNVNSIALQPDGSIVVGGFFASYNGTSANGIIRLNTNGSVDTSFVYGTGFDNEVYSIVIESNGKIVIGGLFTSYKGISANRIIRLNPTGSIDSTWQIGTGFNNTVKSINFNNNQSAVMVTGDFTQFNGVSANRVTRLLL